MGDSSFASTEGYSTLARKRPELTRLLTEAQRRGYVGPGPVARQIDHSLGFLEVLESVRPAVAGAPLLDLGSGGGIPGLIIALVRQPLNTALIDGSVRRAAWLASAVERLELADSVNVIGERAEIAGRLPEWRHRFGIVIARSFGKPAVTAECAAPLLAEGGVLIVSEPTGDAFEPPLSDRCAEDADDPARARNLLGGSQHTQNRWPNEGLSSLGFGSAAVRSGRGYSFVTIPMLSACAERYPRRTGIPTKRPLF
jgi:16S rRNA (guanine527-N7)-methyltransferase